MAIILFSRLHQNISSRQNLRRLRCLLRNYRDSLQNSVASSKNYHVAYSAFEAASFAPAPAPELARVLELGHAVVVAADFAVAAVVAAVGDVGRRLGLKLAVAAELVAAAVVVEV